MIISCIVNENELNQISQILKLSISWIVKILNIHRPNSTITDFKKSKIFQEKSLLTSFRTRKETKTLKKKLKSLLYFLSK